MPISDSWTSPQITFVSTDVIDPGEYRTWADFPEPFEHEQGVGTTLLNGRDRFWDAVATHLPFRGQRSRD